MDTPTGYQRPFAVYLVEEVDASGEPAQFGGFTTLQEAERLMARLTAEGHSVYINAVPVHERFEDYEFDR